MIAHDEDEFFHNLQQEVSANARDESTHTIEVFMRLYAEEMEGGGIIDGYEFCYYRDRGRGRQADGYWFSEDDGAGVALSLFASDFEQRERLESLTKTEVEAIFGRLTTFLQGSMSGSLHVDLEETSPEYRLARSIYDRRKDIHAVRVFLCSERRLSDRLQTLEGRDISGISVSFHVWDTSRLFRQHIAKGDREPLDIDFRDLFGETLPCLRAVEREDYQAYLAAVPGTMLAEIYGRHGARLLEQNVRSFLQAKGKVNKGIRDTLLNEPQMLFAYNNGITATAQRVETEGWGIGLRLVKIKDLQIVNGGQTVASLFHTKRKSKVSMKGTAVQMKLLVLDSEHAETLVPKISKYANTQNRVSMADFSSNYPFHIRMEEFSRRLWAPAKDGAQRETKWFYERARGQYDDAQSTYTTTERRRFQETHPKNQKFTKTDLAKFDGVWDDHPKWVNLGAQKNFAHYSDHIGREWEEKEAQFDEGYFKRVVARAIFFRATEKIVSSQTWYQGGYRANIVAYALSLLSEICRQEGRVVNFNQIWKDQKISQPIKGALIESAKAAHYCLMRPLSPWSNVTEWSKKEQCWENLKENIGIVRDAIPEDFFQNLHDLPLRGGD